MRTFGIWIFGLLASAILGALIGSKLGSEYNNDSGFFGLLAGAFAFACIRLWLGQSRSQQE
jgi:hypothetical protein